MIRGLHHIAILCSDREASLRFYETLGFDLYESHPRPERQDEILMLCSEFGRKIHVELNNKEDISFYGKISLIEEQLPDSSFVKVNSGTIVNLHYIATFSQNVITLINGENVSISRSRRKTVRFLYNQFIERNFGI